jgi:hypothetical protein
MSSMVRRMGSFVGRYPWQMLDRIRTKVPIVLAHLRRHLLLLSWVITFLTLAGVLWSPPTWLSVTFAVLRQHLLSVGVLGLGLGGLLLVWGPKWQVACLDLTPEERSKREDEVRKTLAQILGGIVVMVGLYFTWVNLYITQETATRNQEIAQKGQITERFSRVVDQLGNAKLETRLGGIYALAQIAKTSPNDHWPIMEILMAYIRENAPWPPRKPHSFETEQLQGGASVSEKNRLPLKPATDIQAILMVLKERTHTNEVDGQILNLEDTDLRGGNLVAVNLIWANLRNAHLEGAILARAQLEVADLRGAHLQGANLGRAELNSADLRGAHLEGSNLSRGIVKLMVISEK